MPVMVAVDDPNNNKIHIRLPDEEQGEGIVDGSIRTLSP